MPTRLESTLLGALPDSSSGSRKLSRVAVAMGNNPEVIGCIGRGISAGLADFVFIGPTEEIRRTAGDAGVDISSAEIVEETDPVGASRHAARMAGEGTAGSQKTKTAQSVRYYAGSGGVVDQGVPTREPRLR